MEDKTAKESVAAATRKKWRQWLKANGRKKTSVWLLLYRKNSGQKTISYAEAVEEALCFGWIDNLANRRDEESYYLHFTPRKPKSNWSKLNITRAERMIKEGLMMPEGQQLIDLAKEDGRWKS